MSSSPASNAGTGKFSLVILVGIVVAIFGATRRSRRKLLHKGISSQPLADPSANHGSVGLARAEFVTLEPVRPFPPPGWYADPQSRPGSRGSSTGTAHAGLGRSSETSTGDNSLTQSSWSLYI